MFVNRSSQMASEILVFTTPEPSPSLVFFDYKTLERFKKIPFENPITSFDVAPLMNLIACATTKKDILLVEFSMENEDLAYSTGILPHQSRAPHVLKFNSNTTMLYSVSENMLCSFLTRRSNQIGDNSKIFKEDKFLWRNYKNSE